MFLAVFHPRYSCLLVNVSKLAERNGSRLGGIVWKQQRNGDLKQLPVPVILSFSVWVGIFSPLLPPEFLAVEHIYIRTEGYEQFPQCAFSCMSGDVAGHPILAEHISQANKRHNAYFS